jgi:hypothetical protein
MSVRPAQTRAPDRAPVARAAKPRWPDRLFIGGCTAAYAALIGAVLMALRAYGG